MARDRAEPAARRRAGGRDRGARPGGAPGGARARRGGVARHPGPAWPPLLLVFGDRGRAGRDRPRRGASAGRTPARRARHAGRRLLAGARRAASAARAPRPRTIGWRAWWPAAALALAVALLWRWGAFDALSLVAEYRARADRVQAALLQHLALSAASLALAAAFAVPLGWWAFRSAARGGRDRRRCSTARRWCRRSRCSGC